MFGIKRNVYWCPESTCTVPSRFYEDVGHLSEEFVTGCYRVETYFRGELLFDDIHVDKTIEHYHAPRIEQWKAQVSRHEKAIQLRAQKEEDFLSSAAGLLMEELDGVVATIQNTFDNGYTSIWNYKIQDGRFIVQKPWGNQARAEFSCIEDMAADFRRYLSYGFTIAG